MGRNDSVHFIDGVFTGEEKDLGFNEKVNKPRERVSVETIPVSNTGSQSDISSEISDDNNINAAEPNPEAPITVEERDLGFNENVIHPTEQVSIETIPMSDTGSHTTSEISDEEAKNDFIVAESNSEAPITAEEKLQKSTAEPNAEAPIIVEENPHESTATQILHIIQSFSVHAERGTGTSEAFDKFLPIVTKYVVRNDRIRILLPAFPFKSPNTKTVTLGTLPDFGEELALRRMDSLGDRIKAVYEPGAEIQICSDGLVYGDVVGVPEETLWAYGCELRDMATRMQLSNLTFVRLWDILSHPGAEIQDREEAKKYYLTHATCLRRELVFRYADANFDADDAIKNDKDWQLTYQSYIDYLTREFENHSSAEDVAKRMLVRGKAYVTALAANRSEYIRLSIHDSVGKGKLSVSLIPREKGTVGYMPWRSAVAVDGNGTYRTVFPGDVRDTHEIVYQNGRPYLLRVKSELFDWRSEGLDVEFEHLYPRGLVVRPKIGTGHASSLLPLIPMEKVRQLSKNFAPIVLRGFLGSPNESLYVLKADDLNEVSV